MQPAHGDDRTARRARRQRRVLGVTLAQAGQEVGDVLRTDGTDVRQCSPLQRRGIPVQVTPVCLQRVGGQASLYRQVVEVSRDGLGGRSQLRTSARVAAGRPCASATGSQVT
jgi:hypothetical protein